MLKSIVAPNLNCGIGWSLQISLFYLRSTTFLVVAGMWQLGTVAELRTRT